MMADVMRTGDAEPAPRRALDVDGWTLQGGPFDGIVVTTGANDPPIIGVSIFPDRLVVLGKPGGEVTYEIVPPDGPGDPRRAVYVEAA